MFVETTDVQYKKVHTNFTDKDVHHKQSVYSILLATKIEVRNIKMVVHGNTQPQKVGNKAICPHI